MSETFREPTPVELQATLIQFMGQNLGEIKKLDSNILDRNNTLQGLTLQPEAVLRTLPTVAPPPQPPPQPVVREPIQNVPITDQIAVVTVQPEPNPHDPNQLVFDFITDLKQTPSLKDTIISIEKKVSVIPDLYSNLYKVDKKLDEIIELLQQADLKKKE